MVFDDARLEVGSEIFCIEGSQFLRKFIGKNETTVSCESCPNQAMDVGIVNGTEDSYPRDNAQRPL